MRSFLAIFFLPLLLVADVELAPLIMWDGPDPVSGYSSELRLLGPLFSYKTKVQGDAELAIRPLFSYKKAGDKSGTDLIWPLGMTRNAGDSSVYWFFPYYHHRIPDSSSTHAVLPFFYFSSGKDAPSSWLFFPVAGNVHNFFRLGNTSFCLWPLYVHTEQTGMSNHYYVWPLFGYGKGSNGNHLRIFPLYVEREVKAKRKTQSFIWPLLTISRSLNPENPGYAFFSFPLGGYENWNGITNRTLLWPFFTWKTAADGSDVLSVPWPVFRFGKGTADQSMLNFWPAFGYSTSADAGQCFFLWPLGTYLKSGSERQEEQWLCLLPLYWSFQKKSKDRKQPEFRWRHVWPLFSVVKDQDRETIRGLDLFPLKRAGGWERNLAPLLTLFEYEKNPRGIRWEILWNMFGATFGKDRTKYHVGPFFSSCQAEKESEIQVLFGLYQYRRDGRKNRHRILYFLDFSTNP